MLSITRAPKPVAPAVLTLFLQLTPTHVGHSYAHQDDLAGCTLFIAPSIIPNAGLGLFTTEAYKDETKLHWLPADIVIPYGLPEDDDDDEDDARDERLGGLKRYDWESVTADDEEHPYMPYEEGENIFEFWPGFGSMCNSEHHYENIRNGSGPDEDNADVPVIDQYERPHPGTGAFTPFHHRYAEAAQDIAAGAELFNSYGDGFFLYKKGNPYDFVPLDDDYNDAEKLMKKVVKEDNQYRHYNNNQGLDQDGLQESWDTVVNSAPLRVQTALPKNVTRILETQGQEFSLGVNQRSLEWIRKEGICVDRVYIGASDITEAGRGVFAKQHIPASAIILPVPVIQVNRTLQQITHHDTTSSDSSIPSHRMIVNYCMGHNDSTLLLCPYLTTVSLINHSNNPIDINTKLQLSSLQYANHTLLETSAHDLLEWKRAERSLGIVFDIIATRNILEGEEIYLNYGPEWQHAWEDHLQAWRPFVHNLPIFDKSETDEHAVLAIDTIVDDCTVNFTDDEDGTNDETNDVPKCLKSKIFEIMQQSPEERHANTPPAGCYYFPDWDADTILSHDTAMQMQQDKMSLNLFYFQVHPWAFEVFGWTNTGKEDSSDDSDDTDDDIVTGTVGGLYPCHVLATQARDGDEEEQEEDTLYTVLVLLDHDMASNKGMDYDENDSDNQDHTRNQGQLTRRQVQLVKNVPERALRSITQEWRDQPPVNYLRDLKHYKKSDPDGGIRTPPPFRHYIGVDDDVFPDAWKDLRRP